MGEAVLDRLLDRLVRKSAAGFGGRLAYFVFWRGAEPGYRYLLSGAGGEYPQGYGQTGLSLISANRPGRIRIETVGPAVDGVEVTLGKMVSFWPEATA